MAKKPASVVTQMRNGIDQFGWCRTNAHRWRPPSETGRALSVSRGVVHVEYICDGCDGRRLDSIELKTGYVIKRKYTMPDGYTLVVKGTGDERPRKPAWRKEHFRNLLRGAR